MVNTHAQTNNLTQAKQALEAAQCRFDYATGEHIDAAVLELSAAKLRLSSAIRESRSLFCLNGMANLDNTGKECHNDD